ncbi:MAG: HlyD family type I secretion periplasmic adaptor subunit, partial [Alphaproteobacteria bacterium]|nr:HlyD family type I secretion periplasmic adaptor subunit [Alphaproteobacteria bacterium]
QQELNITSEMVRQQAVPKLEEIRLRRELSDSQGQLKAEQEKQNGLKAELGAAQKQLKDQDDKFRSQALGELSAVETEMAQLNESLKSIGDRVYRTELRAPVDGIINNIALKTIGGVIEPAHKLIEIVPVDDELKIIAKVRPSDIAFLKVDQPVKVKISAYDPQRYGALDGKLVRIGANSVTDRDGNIFFEIEVRTDKNYLGSAEHKLPITPGMVASTEVITGKRTIMEYLMKPVLRARDRALRER